MCLLFRGEKKTFLGGTCLLHHGSYFQMTHIDPEECWNDYLDPLRGRRCTGLLARHVGKIAQALQSHHRLDAAPCLAHDIRTVRQSAQAQPLIPVVNTSVFHWWRAVLFPVFLCIRSHLILITCAVGRSSRDKHHLYFVNEKTEAQVWFSPKDIRTIDTESGPWMQVCLDHWHNVIGRILKQTFNPNPKRQDLLVHPWTEPNAKF